MTKNLKFITFFLMAAATVLGSIAAFMYVVDPYGFWNSGMINRKVYRDAPPKLYHAVSIAQTDYDVVFVGTSRVREGFIPEMFEKPNLKVYNAGFSGATAWEIGRMMQSLAAIGSPETAVVGIDFFSFAPGNKYNPDSLYTPVTGMPLFLAKAINMFSTAAIDDAILIMTDDVIHHSRFGYKILGFASYAPGNHLERFKDGLIQHGSFYLAGYDPNTPEVNKPFLKVVEQGARDLAAKGTRVVLYINPVHASRLRFIGEMGLAQHYEALMQAVIDMTNDVARDYPGRIEFWDFSDCHGILGEYVPHDAAQIMTYFYDSNHFTPNFGQIIWDQAVIKTPPQEGTAPAYGGRLLAPATGDAMTTVPFTRNWDDCRSNIDSLVSRLVKSTAAARCAANASWCGFSPPP